MNNLQQSIENAIVRHKGGLIGRARLVSYAYKRIGHKHCFRMGSHETNLRARTLFTKT